MEVIKGDKPSSPSPSPGAGVSSFFSSFFSSAAFFTFPEYTNFHCIDMIRCFQVKHLIVLLLKIVQKSGLNLLNIKTFKNYQYRGMSISLICNNISELFWIMIIHNKDFFNWIMHPFFWFTSQVYIWRWKTTVKYKMLISNGYGVFYEEILTFGRCRSSFFTFAALGAFLSTRHSIATARLAGFGCFLPSSILYQSIYMINKFE